MIKLYGNPRSTCTRKVLMTLAELKTPFEMNVVDFTKGEHKQEPHISRQPFGRIPTIDDDGFEMFESRAICRYLNERANGHLVPGDAQGRAKMEQWISVETSEFSVNAMKFIYEHTFKRAQDPAVLEAAGKALTLTCSVMDKQLAKTDFIAGPTFTLADIGYMPYAEYLMGGPAKTFLTANPHVSSWWTRISTRPTWQTVIG